LLNESNFVDSEYQPGLVKPTRLLYPTDWFPVANGSQQKMNEAFLQALEESLGIKHTKVSLIDEWSRSAPDPYRNLTLREFLGKSANHINQYYVYHSFDGFRKEYQEEFGQQPYVSPSHLARWERGATVTDEERDQSLAKIDVFKKWVDREIWQRHDQSDISIMIVPQGRPGANYRDVVGTPAGGAPAGSYTTILTTSMLGCPQLVVPIGQNPYESKISGRTEYAPIMTTLIGPQRSDRLLLHTAVEAMQKAGWPTDILTGRTMFHLGQNERNAQSSPRERL